MIGWVLVVGLFNWLFAQGTGVPTTQLQERGQDPPNQVLVWTPRVNDVGSGSTEHDLLRYALRESESVQAIPRPGESVADLIRRLFFVDAIGHPRAYALYLEDIRRRNPGVDVAGTAPLAVPAGPRFAASSVTSTGVTTESLKHAMDTIQSAVAGAQGTIRKHVLAHP
jgi:hypothetical protein